MMLSGILVSTVTTKAKLSQSCQDKKRFYSCKFDLVAQYISISYIVQINVPVFYALR